MYDPLTPAEEEGARAFRQLLKERTGYPKRGSLEKASAIVDIPGPSLGRYIRGESAPTDRNLQKLAPYLGRSFRDLKTMLIEGSDVVAAPPDEDDVFRLNEIVEEAQRIIQRLRTRAVQSTIAPERRRKRSKRVMDNNQPKSHYDHQNALIIESLVGSNRAGNHRTVRPALAATA